jgi:hypothetical protein
MRKSVQCKENRIAKLQFWFLKQNMTSHNLFYYLLRISHGDVL